MWYCYVWEIALAAAAYVTRGLDPYQVARLRVRLRNLR